MSTYLDGVVAELRGSNACCIPVTAYLGGWPPVVAHAITGIAIGAT
jgi:hypothetical protein